MSNYIIDTCIRSNILIVKSGHLIPYYSLVCHKCKRGTSATTDVQVRGDDAVVTGEIVDLELPRLQHPGVAMQKHDRFGGPFRL